MRKLFLFKLYVEIIPLLSALKADAQNNFKYLDIDCDIANIYHVYCSRTAKLTNKIPTLPVHKIPSPVKILEAHLSINSSWLIDDHTMFHRFSNLSEIRLVGRVSFSSTYNDKQMKAQLLNSLFDLPSLKFLMLWYWYLDNSYSWTFPNKLEILTIFKNNYSLLDLSACENLTYLSVKHGKLAKMPKLSSSPPPLKGLVLSNVPTMEFTVHDIMPLCFLQSISLNAFNGHLPRMDRFCECTWLKIYLKTFDVKEIEPILCDDFEFECEQYPVDDVIAQHNALCESLLNSSKETKWPDRPSWPEMTPSWELVPGTSHPKLKPSSGGKMESCPGTSCAWVFFQGILFFIFLLALLSIPIGIAWRFYL